MNLMITKAKCPTCQKQIEIGFEKAWIWSKIICPHCNSKLAWDVNKKIALSLLIIMLLSPVYLFMTINRDQVCFQVLFPIVFIILGILSMASARLKKLDNEN